MSARVGNKAKSERDSDAAARRAGQKQKMDWVKTLWADTELGDAAKTVGAAAAMNLAYSRMEFRATYKELGRLSGKSARGADKAAAVLAEKNYWKVEHNPGGANRYTLIPLSDREEMWNRKAGEWRQLCLQWDAEKRDWEYRAEKWLEAEATYNWLAAEEREKHEWTMALFSALYRRDADFELARHACENGWAYHQANGHMPIDEVVAYVRELPEDVFRERFIAPVAEPEPTKPAGETPTPEGDGGTPQVYEVAHQRCAGGYIAGAGGSTPTNSLISGNDRSTSSTRITRSEVLQDAHALRAAEPARAALAQTTTTAAVCQLCDDMGRMTYRGYDDGEQFEIVIRLMKLTPDGLDTIEHELSCLHSEERNVTYILQRINDDPELEPCSTGYSEIDSLFGDE